MLVEPGETCHSMSLVVGFRLGHSPFAVVVTARGNKSYNRAPFKDSYWVGERRIWLLGFSL